MLTLIAKQIFSEGITNKLFGIRLASAPLKETVIIKVYGNQTDLLIDREQEIVTFTVLAFFIFLINLHEFN